MCLFALMCTRGELLWTRNLMMHVLLAGVSMFENMFLYKGVNMIGRIYFKQTLKGILNYITRWQIHMNSYNLIRTF